MSSPLAALIASRAQLSAGHLTQAEAGLRRLCQGHSRNADAHHLLGEVLDRLGRKEQALYFLRRAVELEPQHGPARLALGELMYNASRFVEASEHFAAAADPGAEESFRRAMGLYPGRKDAGAQCADLLLRMGRPEDALGRARRSVADDPDDLRCRLAVALYANYASDLDARTVFDEHRAVAAITTAIPLPAHAPPAAPGAGAADRPLRVSLLSPNLGQHAVSYFLEPILEYHDPAAVTYYAYAVGVKPDETARRLRARCAGWRDFPGPEAEAMALEALAEDRIDIAIDLAGYTNKSFFWVLREPVVPVQATYLGYPHSTAMASIGFRLVDSITDPPGAEALSTETLVRLDPCFLCYRPPPDAPPPSLSGAGPDLRAPVTFGSFNMLGKLSQATRALWAGVLHAVPGSRLLLKAFTLGDPRVCARLQADFAAAGIDPERLILLDTVPDRGGHLAVYGRVDIALDPVPYNGTTTTCEALHMGVPVVTMAGRAHAGRVGASLLAAAGHPELVARDESDYVRLAAELAADPARLAGLRSTLRTDLERSVLCDGPAFARRFEAALRSMWAARAPGA
jgi:protein O-GlcNAc transferase